MLQQPTTHTLVCKLVAIDNKVVRAHPTGQVVGGLMKKMHGRSLFELVLLALALAAAIPSAHTQTLSQLYNFNNDGGVDDTDPLYFAQPGTQAQGLDGNVYTTSQNGYTLNSGAFFKMSPTSPASVLTELTSFDPFIDGGCEGVISGVTLGSDDNFHGAIQECPEIPGSGAVMTLTPSGGLNYPYIFTGGSDGGQPPSAPVQGMDGNYYGTTLIGGGPANRGTIYRITPTGVLTTLYQFDEAHGFAAYAPLTLGTDGNFYGVAEAGGMNNLGVVFKIATSGQYTVLYNFDGPHGATPFGPLVQGSNGDFYGTTEGGGVGVNANGVVFQITPAGKLKVLHTFDPTMGDGINTLAGLTLATDGYFYGVSSEGGTSPNCASGCGTIFRLKSKTTYENLYNFDSTTGSFPQNSLLQNTDGLLYGLATFGGIYNSGVFFSWSEGLKPFVMLVSTSGAVGTPIGILGQGFTGTKKVTFAGGAAVFTVISDTQLMATVPSGATTGFVSVKTPSGTLKSNKKFIVTP
jgi:uncharacterized repeat protein (TIGR03803 family)